MTALHRPGAIRLISCYESGHQPLALASAMAFLERAGFRPRAVDLAAQRLEVLFGQGAGDVRLVAVSVPMHTAMHIGVRAATRIRNELPGAHLCFFGLYAMLNADHLLATVADSVIGGESETPLVRLAEALEGQRKLEDVPGLRLPGRHAGPHLERADFPVPSRTGLPAAGGYARLEIRGEQRAAAAIEASRGCLHHCRHCPIPPVYGGRFFVVPREVVMEDVRALLDAGIRHLSFADPDFFNGPRHTMAVARQLRAESASLTFDITTKIENVLKHRSRFDELARCGCVFVVSAVESLSDTVLRQLAKGHSREDVFEALRIVSAAGLCLRPSLLPFTPWATLEDYLELLDWIESGSMIHHVDAVQLSIRLLVPPGSLLADSPGMRPHLRGLDAERFGHRWEHPDPRMDRLQREIGAIVRQAALEGTETPATYARIRDAAHRARGLPLTPTRILPAVAAARPPRLTEPWFC